MSEESEPAGGVALVAALRDGRWHVEEGRSPATPGGVRLAGACDRWALDERLRELVADVPASVDDTLALDAPTAFREAGLRVPDDVSPAGCADVPAPDVVPPVALCASTRAPA